MRIPSAAEALPGRSTAMAVPETHYVNRHRIVPPFPDGLELAMFGLGCFWGAERKFWELKGVYSTAVGYAAGHTPNPTYREVCTGMTGHTEAVLVVFDPKIVSYEDLLKTFWENHDPTQGMRQGNDIGTQYRSGVYYYSESQRRAAEASREMFQKELEDGIRQGKFLPVDVQVTAYGILAMTTWVSSWYSPRGRLSLEEIADIYSDMVLRGIWNPAAGHLETHLRRVGRDNARRTLAAAGAAK